MFSLAQFLFFLADPTYEKYVLLMRYSKAYRFVVTTFFSVCPRPVVIMEQTCLFLTGCLQFYCLHVLINSANLNFTYLHNVREYIIRINIRLPTQEYLRSQTLYPCANEACHTVDYRSH